MDPEVFGPILWKSIHIIAVGYPENPSELDKTMYMTYFRDLWKIIPCYKCSVNYKKHWDELPITPYLVSKHALFEWTVLLHNIVNKELGKSEMKITDAWKLYTEKSNNTKNTNMCLMCIILLLVFIILALILLRNTKKI